MRIKNIKIHSYTLYDFDSGRSNECIDFTIKCILIIYLFNFLFVPV